jgi:secreted Zn-dependent insulinase-like peptidase
MTKSGALRYGQMMARRLNYLRSIEAQVDQILYTPYNLEDYDEQDIKTRLDCLNPENMFVLYHSRLV